MEIQISYPLAFVAGFVSFLSPCILPVVPSYLAFVSGLTFEELTGGSVPTARKAATLHSVAFVLGFSLVFMTLGLVATSLGSAIAGALPWINRAGGVIVIGFGLVVAGVVELPALARERRVDL
ncbi:MAG: cytochrome c biogenesis protein CcdA, partial [Gemmatimonadota bacterium]|nr:cytochrome c biogenesis protein CcdA [Gemmatimonadota bacterium]